MAIITENTNARPMSQLCLADGYKTEIVAIKETVQKDICICECEYTSPVFADLVDVSEYKNDKSSFIFDLQSNFATSNIYLVDSQEVEYSVEGGLYGDYFAKGSFTNSDKQKNYVGVVIDWKKVLNLLGPDNYYIKFNQNIFSQVFTTKTFIYKLTSFSDLKANKTIKFAWTQNGLIESGIDFSGLNWKNELRIEGKLKYLEPEITLTNYVTSLGVRKQIQDKVLEKIECETYFITSEILDIFAKNVVLANEIYVTNYDLYAFKNYLKFAVLIQEISNFKGNYTSNSKGSATLQMTERTENTRKRNI